MRIKEKIKNIIKKISLSKEERELIDKILNSTKKDVQQFKVKLTQNEKELLYKLSQKTIVIEKFNGYNVCTLLTMYPVKSDEVYVFFNINTNIDVERIKQVKAS